MHTNTFCKYRKKLLASPRVQLVLYENNNIVLYLNACYRVGDMLPVEHYETLVLFFVHLVLKMFKILISI